MSMVSPWRRIFLWALVIFGGASLLLLIVLMARKNLVQKEMTSTLHHARQLQRAMQMMSQDAMVNEKNARGGLPADLGIKSRAELLTRLAKSNDLSLAEARKLSMGFAFVNTSAADPPETVLLVSGGLPSDRAHDDRFVVMTIGGSGGVYARPGDLHRSDIVKLPNRQPQILPDE